MSQANADFREQYPELFNHPTIPATEIHPILGMSKTAVYTAIKNGNFPFPTLRVGGRIIIPTAPIRAALGLDAPAAA